MAETYMLKKGEEFPKGLRLAQDISCTLSNLPRDVLLQGPVIVYANGSHDFNGLGTSIEQALNDLKRKMYEEFERWRYESPNMNPAMLDLSIKLGALFGLKKEQVIVR